MIVVDASVAVKWFIPETGSDKAETLLYNTERLFAPEIIRLEVAGAISRLYRMDVIQHDDAMDLCQEWSRFIKQGAMALSSVNTDYHRAVDLSIELKHPIADCLYLAVAERLKIPVFTADKAMADQAKILGLNTTLF